MSYANARRLYMADAVQTVPPGTLLVMLYDALLRNLDQAVVALLRRDLAAAHAKLIRGQEILAELDASLDVDAWSGGPRLRGLYRFVEHELVEANVAKDVDRVRACRDLIAPLADAWRRAATADAPAMSAAQG